MCTLIPLSPRGRFRSSSPWPEGHWTPGRGHVPSLCPGQRHIGGCPRRAGYRNDAVGLGMSALRLLERRIRDLRSAHRIADSVEHGHFDGLQGGSDDD